MFRSRCALFGILAFVLSGTMARAAAVEEASPADPQVVKLDDKITQFLKGVAAGDASQSFAEFLVGSPLAEQDTAVRGLVDKAKQIADRYGAYRDSEQVSAKRIGKDVLLLKYLFKCEKYPVVWYFLYYRDFARPVSAGENNWVVISVRFDTQVELLGL